MFVHSIEQHAALAGGVLSQHIRGPHSQERIALLVCDILQKGGSLGWFAGVLLKLSSIPRSSYDRSGNMLPETVVTASFKQKNILQTPGHFLRVERSASPVKSVRAEVRLFCRIKRCSVQINGSQEKSKSAHVLMPHVQINIRIPTVSRSRARMQKTRHSKASCSEAVLTLRVTALAAATCS